MKCDVEKIKIHMFFDNQLGKEESKLISEHINQCEDCRREFEFLSYIKPQLSSVSNTAIDEELKRQLIAIGRKRIRVIELFEDVLKIMFKYRNGMFQIDLFSEDLLREKYPERILRWVFYC